MSKNIGKKEQETSVKILKDIDKLAIIRTMAVVISVCIQALILYKVFH